MESLKKIESLLEKELDKMAIKPELNATDLEVLCKVMKVMKDMNEVDMAYDKDGYSGNYYPMRRWDDTRYPVNSYMRNPRYGEYSRHSINDRVINKLEIMMDETTSEHERDQLRKMIRDIRESE